MKNPAVEIRVFPGADGSFTLYDDAGDGYQYEKGEFSEIPLKWDDAKKTLTIVARCGSYPGMAWCEGPHLYKIDGTYYLMTAEGGTGYMHSEVVCRADNVEGPYEPWKVSPILTQRDLQYGRKDGVYCAGHADLIETPSGDWMAVFLGILPYNEIQGGDNSPTGRNTFMLPVTWIGESKDRQPMILEQGTSVPLVVDKPEWMVKASANAARCRVSQSMGLWPFWAMVWRRLTCYDRIVLCARFWLFLLFPSCTRRGFAARRIRCRRKRFSD